MPSPAAMSPSAPSSWNADAADPPIDARSPVTVTPVLAGFVPGVTSTVSSVVCVTASDAGAAAPIPLGDVGTAAGKTPRTIAVLPLRACASVIVTANVFSLGNVSAGTVDANENVPSPAAMSPCVPSS
jgi:hypothetical protein